MYTERSMKDALRDYLKGKKVLVIAVFDDGSMDIQKLEDILPKANYHYLVDVPAVPNPEFEQAVRGDGSRNMTPPGQIIIDAAHEMQDHPDMGVQSVPCSEKSEEADETESEMQNCDSMESSDRESSTPRKRWKDWKRRRM